MIAEASTCSSSTHVIYTITGIPLFAQNSKLFLVPTSTPDLPLITMIAPSATLNASYTSPEKSKKPGVSKRFTLTPSTSRGITED